MIREITAMRAKKRKLREKTVNVFTISHGADKFMRNHPLYGEQYRKNEGFKKLFDPKQRLFRSGR